MGACFVPDFALKFNAYEKYMGIVYNQMIKYFKKKDQTKSNNSNRLVKIDEKYGKPQKNCNRIILEIFQS